MRPNFLALPIAIAWAAAAGCVDDPDPFVPPDRERPAEPTWQLTFNLGNDRAPAWTRDGSRVIYTAEGFLDAPDSPGVLLSVPFERGASEKALINVQEEGGPIRWLTTPAPAPDGERLAFAHMIFLFDAELCGPPALVDCGEPVTEPLPLPRLGTVAFRVRRFDARGPLTDDPALELEFEGRFFDGTQHPNGLPGVWIIDYHPFHQVHVEEGTLIFRPSWTPDGRRIAFSDGMRINIWDVAEESVTPVVGTEGGASPAWSPDGESIAFTRYVGEAPGTSFCEHFLEVPGGVSLGCAQERTSFTIDGRVLTVVRPDGDALMELDEGEEPAWAPDGETIFYRKEDRIWMISLDGGPPVQVPETEGGREPAVSPDGLHLAFARRGADNAYSIWINTLEF